MAKNFRKERIGEEIKKIISEMLIKGELKDPRLSGMVSITAVDVTRDGSYAKVFLTVFGSADDADAKAEREAEVLEGMEHAKGIIRKTISRELKLRHTPELRFRIDESFERGMEMDALLESLVKNDEE
jgi:ribosome-binding factor A